VNIRIFYIVAISVVLTACSDFSKTGSVDHGPAMPRDRIVEQQDPLAALFHDQVKPVLEKRCVVCHGCYDAPCQLKLSSPEGIDRGFSPELVYGSRILETAPTRLFIDAQTTQQWREKNYISVLNEHDQTSTNNLDQSVLFQLLALKEQHPLPNSQTLSKEDFDFSLSRDQTCPDMSNIEAYKKEQPFAGMPYGLPNLAKHEFDTLREWVKYGSPMAQPAPISQSLSERVAKWEVIFNGNTNKAKLINRYIYEHLFLGHLYFSEEKKIKDQLPVYFRLVRSTTPSGQPIKEIASRRPYDDPNTEQVYYRLRRDTTTVLTKTHLPYALNKQRLARWNELFYQSAFSVSDLPAYDNGSNPFKVFASIPPYSRYQFLLDEAEYTIMGFIKGPVCRGQTALNVIQDKFWVFFSNPDYLKNENYINFINQQADNLELPSDFDARKSTLYGWIKYSKRAKKYFQTQIETLNNIENTEQYLDYDSLWKNDKNASLTIFRHFDSAEVVKGLQGKSPKTAWVIDYPVLERIHYLLVAGYDVYGGLGHQLITRLYMDLLRIESEMAFITYLPKEQRQSEVNSWYLDATEDLDEYINENNFFFEQKNSISYQTDHALKELFSSLKKRYKASEKYDLDVITGGLSGLNELPNLAVQQIAPISFIIVDNEQNNTELYSLLKHNERSNISTLLREKNTRLPELDRAEVFKGLLGSYPQVIFKITEQQQSAFVAQLKQVSTAEEYSALLKAFAIRRTHPEFWQVSDKLHETYQQQSPINYGLLDYNRLENR
jgi:hypothetical protein